LDKDALQEGRELELPDGSLLYIGLAKQLTLLRDGRPIPGSAAGAETLLKTVSGVLFVMGGLYFLPGLWAQFGGTTIVGPVPGWASALSALCGIAFLVLASRVRRGSRIALAIAGTLVAGFMVLNIVAWLPVLRNGPLPLVLGEAVGLFLQACILVLIGRAFGAIRMLEAAEREAAEGSLPEEDSETATEVAD
jgi:hypothetical protein